MKKLLSAFAAILICLSMTISSFAAVSLNGEYTFVDGTTIYTFGEFEGNVDEVGVKVGDTLYPVSDAKLYQANKFGKFGIGLKDPKNTLGLEFDVKPYVKTGENVIEGEAVRAAKNVLASITSVTVGGKAISGFYPGTEETEFYFDGATEITLTLKAA